MQNLKPLDFHWDQNAATDFQKDLQLLGKYNGFFVNLEHGEVGGTEFHVSLKIVAATSKNKEQSFWNARCLKYGLKPEDYGKVIDVVDGKAALCEIDASNKTNRIIAKMQINGIKYAVSSTEVVKQLQEEELELKFYEDDLEEDLQEDLEKNSKDSVPEKDSQKASKKSLICNKDKLPKCDQVAQCQAIVQNQKTKKAAKRIEVKEQPANKVAQSELPLTPAQKAVQTKKRKGTFLTSGKKAAETRRKNKLEKLTNVCSFCDVKTYCVQTPENGWSCEECSLLCAQQAKEKQIELEADEKLEKQKELAEKRAYCVAKKATLK